MRLAKTILIAAFIMVLAAMPAVAGEVTKTFTVTGSQSDGYNKLYNGMANISSGYAYVGAGYLTAWRFESVPIPPGANIISANVVLYCHFHNAAPVDLTYYGEAADNSEAFKPRVFDLMNRPKTTATVADSPGEWQLHGFNSTPDLTSIVQEIVNREGWRSRNALTILADGSSSPDKRGIYMMEKGEQYAARLVVTYEVAKITFDTDGDGDVDITMEDNDGDGYFEAPTGKTEYSGTLKITQPVEIMGGPYTRVETNFKGEEFVLGEGGQIITDQVSPIVADIHPDFRGCDLQIVAKDIIRIEFGARILLGPDAAGDYAGDVYMETTRSGADLIIKEDVAVFGRHIDLLSDIGSINLREGVSLMATSNVNFRIVTEGDIHLNRNVTVGASSLDGDCDLKFFTENGDLHMNREVKLTADLVDFCSVNGNIWDDGTVTIIGNTECWQ